MLYAVAVAVTVAVAVPVVPAERCRYELQNVVAGPCSCFSTDNAPVITAQPVGFGVLARAAASALPKNRTERERKMDVFIAIGVD